jgi:hypothetical protein
MYRSSERIQDQCERPFGIAGYGKVGAEGLTDRSGSQVGDPSQSQPHDISVLSRSLGPANR